MAGLTLEKLERLEKLSNIILNDLEIVEKTFNILPTSEGNYRKIVQNLWDGYVEDQNEILEE